MHQICCCTRPESRRNGVARSAARRCRDDDARCGHACRCNSTDIQRENSRKEDEGDIRNVVIKRIGNLLNHSRAGLSCSRRPRGELQLASMTPVECLSELPI